MNYCTTAEMAEKWNISDRRVRTLCRSGRIEGVIYRNDTYLIPSTAVKPADGRYRSARLDRVAVAESVSLENYASSMPQYYLKWQDDVVALIDGGYNVHFVLPGYNAVVENYTRGCRDFNREWLEQFLRERIVSNQRRDIERILLRCNMNSYNIIELGIRTRGINSRDLLWIATSADEKMQDAVDEVFRSIFIQKADADGDSISTPEGNNIKRYGVYNGHYGIFKKRISPLSCDVESEVAVYTLAQLLGVKCCPAYRTDDDTVFSEFMYDWGRDYLVHMRRLFEDGERGENEYLNLLSKRPQYQREIAQMVALDFITRQDDRHLSNIAVKISDDGESFYPLYDNGRSLFYEDTEETARKAYDNIELYATTWGASGTYYDYVRELADAGISFSRILNLDIAASDIERVLVSSGFEGYRLKYASLWIERTIGILRAI